MLKDLLVGPLLPPTPLPLLQTPHLSRSHQRLLAQSMSTRSKKKAAGTAAPIEASLDVLKEPVAPAHDEGNGDTPAPPANLVDNGDSAPTSDSDVPRTPAVACTTTSDDNTAQPDVDVDQSRTDSLLSVVQPSAAGSAAQGDT